MILSGIGIQECILAGEIEIDPFNPEQLNPASYDLTLGQQVSRYDYDGLSDVLLDTKREPLVHRCLIGPYGFELEPGAGYLMHTVERVRTDKFVPVLDGKSSLGRLFVSVHQTAGYGDPGFDGQYTLEVTSLYHVRLYAGMRIAQIRFHMLAGRVELYKGNYRGEAAKGPVPSASWKQFAASEKSYAESPHAGSGGAQGATILVPRHFQGEEDT